MSLHVVEELWQMVTDQSPTLSPEGLDSDSGDDLMALSDLVANGTYTGKTIKFHGYIQRHKAIFLVDSGSSHTFVSAQFATNLPNWKPLAKPIGVKVADGGILQCTHEVQLYDWLVQGVQFRIPLRYCPLSVMMPSWVWIGWRCTSL